MKPRIWCESWAATVLRSNHPCDKASMAKAVIQCVLVGPVSSLLDIAKVWMVLYRPPQARDKGYQHTNT
eukprot:scaffold763_cov402-Prasinococcus_capsulatus_cf.AAC.4